MRLMSPRNTVLYHTLDRSPRVTCPKTTAVEARYTPFPILGWRRRNFANCFSSCVMLILLPHNRTRFRSPCDLLVAGPMEGREQTRPDKGVRHRILPGI